MQRSGRRRCFKHGRQHLTNIGDIYIYKTLLKKIKIKCKHKKLLMKEQKKKNSSSKEERQGQRKKMREKKDEGE